MTQFMLSVYTSNIFKDQNDNLIVILVDSEIKKMLNSAKIQQNSSFKIAQIKPAFDTVFS